jgi:hypothetical protein
VNRGALRREYAAWILADTYRFAKETRILPDIVEQPHREMSNTLCGMEPDFVTVGQRKLLFLAPRGTFKTSLVEAEACRLILKHPDIALAIFRANRELSAAMVRNIAMHLTSNDVILDTFGDISEGSEKWAEFELLSNRRTRPQLSPTLYAASIGTTTTGLHAHVVFMDDLVVRENCDSVKEMHGARVLVQSMNPVIGPHGRVIVSGTMWSNIDVYTWILQRNRKAVEKGEPPAFEEYVRSVYYLDGSGQQQLFAPSLLPEVLIEQQRRELEARYFASWYFNQTYEAGMKPFKNLRFFDGEYSTSPVKSVVLEDEAYAGEVVPVSVAILIDPALTSNASSDSFGVVVVGWDAAENWLALEARELRMLPSDATFEIVSLLLTYEPDLILIESANADSGMVARIGQAIRDAGLGTTVAGYSALQDEVRGQRGKPQRIGALEPLCREGKLWFRRGKCTALVRQMDLYPSVDHDDVIDAFAMGRKALTLVPRPTVGAFEDEGRETAVRFSEVQAARESARYAILGASGSAAPKGAWTGLGSQTYGG